MHASFAGKVEGRRNVYDGIGFGTISVSRNSGIVEMARRGAVLLRTTLITGTARREPCASKKEIEKRTVTSSCTSS